VIRNEINAGGIPGPRLLACSPEMTCTGGLGDDRRMHLDVYTYSLIVDGPLAFSKTTRMYAREGADLVKVGISGNPGLPHAPGDATLMTDDELAAVTTTAHSFGMRVAAHARSNLSVLMALEHGVEFIYHCEHADERTIDQLEAAKDRIFLAPAFAPAYARHVEMEQPSPAARDEAKRTFDAFCVTYTAVRKRGIRVLIGGEYGLPETPHGTNARDIQHFVEFFGYTNREALLAATKWGAEAMQMGDRLGEVKPGYLADLLLVRGRPDEDVRLLQNRENLVAIMKDGTLHKSPQGVR
jgi:imidazolonepropionase-like amidohydrolase